VNGSNIIDCVVRARAIEGTEVVERCNHGCSLIVCHSDEEIGTGRGVGDSKVKPVMRTLGKSLLSGVVYDVQVQFGAGFHFFCQLSNTSVPSSDCSNVTGSAERVSFKLYFDIGVPDLIL
jgi:hypothetical protein